MDLRVCASLILATHLLCLEACREGEYLINGECCPMCGPGYRVTKPCTSSSSTSCLPCLEGTYTDHPNGLSRCIPCQTCDPGSNLRIKERCTYTKNTVCSCASGYFCTHFTNEDCDSCHKHSVSPPGFKVTRTGTETTDTQYIPCPSGTFSTEEMSVSCKPWTNCSESGKTEEESGTATSDAVCKQISTDDTIDNHMHPGLICFLVLLVPSLVVIFLLVRWIKQKCGRKPAVKKQEEPDKGYLTVPVRETNMVEPIQETTQNCSAPSYETV